MEERQPTGKKRKCGSGKKQWLEEKIGNQVPKGYKSKLTLAKKLSTNYANRKRATSVREKDEKGLGILK